MPTRDHHPLTRSTRLALLVGGAAVLAGCFTGERPVLRERTELDGNAALDPVVIGQFYSGTFFQYQDRRSYRRRQTLPVYQGYGYANGYQVE